MKHLISLFIAVSVAFTAFGQSTPPNKLRSNDSFTQVDNYLVAAKRLGIPTGPTPTLNAATSAQNSAKLFYNTTDESLYIYDAIGEVWNPVSADIDLSEYYTIAQVDSAITASSPFNLIDVTQAVYTDKAINVIPFNNTGMSYSEGSIDFGVTRDSTHTMGTYAFKQGAETEASGPYSSAFGAGTTASGLTSSAFGNSTTASGYFSSAFGQGTTASGSASSAFGLQATASGDYSSAFGYSSTASGSYSSAFGERTTANEYASLAIGRFSTDGPVETTWVVGSPVFKVGNGTNNSNRSNAYVLNNDGTSTQYGIASYGADYSANFTDRSLVDKEYVDAQSVLEALPATSGVGYALRGRDPANYGPIGRRSVDLSYSSTPSTTYGATGASALVAGVRNSAGGTASVAFGEGSVASGNRSVAMGNNTTASGANSFAAGNNSIASGSNSVALGRSFATGSNSVAMGFENYANHYGSLTVGRYSTSGSAQAGWVVGDPIFKVGNGTNGANRSNSYVLYNDGRSEQDKDAEVTTVGQGFVLKSPDGTRWRITVDNNGDLTTTSL